MPRNGVRALIDASAGPTCLEQNFKSFTFSGLMANATGKNIVGCVSSGIRKATDEYLKLVNNCQDLSWGPEYFLTVNVLSELKKLNAARITLEEELEEKGKAQKGRQPAGYRPNSRYDIVVKSGNGTPMAAIDVRHRVYSVNERIVKDIQSLSSAVNPNGNGKSPFRLGILGFYTVFEKGGSRSKPPEEAINDLYDKLEERFDDFSGDAFLSSELFPAKEYTDLPGLVWGGGCFILNSE